MTKTTKTRYDRMIVEDSARSAAIGEFVRSVVRKEIRYAGVEHGLPGIVFVRLQAHAEILAKAVGAALGQDVPAVTSEMPRKVRDVLLERMRSRDSELPVVVASMVWSTGIDVPALEWTLWAGEGQAPIWLKQSGGRSTRLAEGKEGYILFDWQTVGPGAEAYQAQAQTRLLHYQEGGFSVALESPMLADEDEEVELLNELLARPNLGSPVRLAAKVDSVPPTPHIDLDEMVRHVLKPHPMAFWSWGKRDGKEDADDPSWAWKAAGRLFMYVICIAAIYYIIQGVGIACNACAHVVT